MKNNNISNTLENVDNVNESYKPETLQKMKIFGAEFDLQVIFKGFFNKAEDVLPSQTKALELFLSKPKNIDRVKPALEKYCKRDARIYNVDVDVSDILSYLTPRAICVAKPTNNESPDMHRVGLMFDYKIDPEHNLVIVFENERFKEIGPEDIIL